MKVFGFRTDRPWGSGLVDEAEHIDTTPARRCAWCEEVIVEGDKGFLVPSSTEMEVAYHYDCFLRSLNGSVGHQLKRCPCYGGKDEDPPGMSRREAARYATTLANVLHSFTRLFERNDAEG